MAAEKNGAQLNLFRGIHGIANSIMAHKHASERLKLAQQHEQLARDKFTHKQNQDKQAQENFTTKENNRMTIHKDNKEHKEKVLQNRKDEFKKTMNLKGHQLEAQMSNNNTKNKETAQHHRAMEKTAEDNSRSYRAYTNSTIDRNDAQTNYTNTRTAAIQNGVGKKGRKPNIQWPEKVSNPHVQDAINTSNTKAGSYTKSASDYGNIKR